MYLKYKKLIRTAFLFVIILPILTGIFFRLYNLEQKVYWGDETFTSLRISGYSLKEFQADVFQGEQIGIDDLLKYQSPSIEKGYQGLVTGLAQEEPQHPPLYFSLARLYTEYLGSSVAITRSLAAIIGILVLPSAYWLCQELFQSPQVGWVAAAIMAISPLHILYAQESRSYSLWTVLILVSSASLLRAIRTQRKADWFLYCITVSLSLYTILLSILFTLSHGIYVFLRERLRLTKLVFYYLISYILAILTFLPWLVISFSEQSTIRQTTAWNSISVVLRRLLETWILNLNRVFWDFNESFSNRLIPIYCLILILTIYSLYFLIKRENFRVYSFILVLMLGTSLPFMAQDVFLGGRASTVARYLLPSYLAIQIAVSYLLVQKLSDTDQGSWPRRVWSLIITSIFVVGLFSNFSYFQVNAWWNKSGSFFEPMATDIINQSERPLVVTYWHHLLPLSHLLKPDTRVQPVKIVDVKQADGRRKRKISVQPISGNFSDVFVYNTPSGLKSILEKQDYVVDRVYKWQRRVSPVDTVKVSLWKLNKQNK